MFDLTLVAVCECVCMRTCKLVRVRGAWRVRVRASRFSIDHRPGPPRLKLPHGMPSQAPACLPATIKQRDFLVAGGAVDALRSTRRSWVCCLGIVL